MIIHFLRILTFCQVSEDLSSDHKITIIKMILRKSQAFQFEIENKLTKVQRNRTKIIQIFKSLVCAVSAKDELKILTAV